MSTDTPMAGDWWCPSCKEALDGSRVTYDERCDTCGTPVSVAGEGDIARLERENASLREELTTRERLYKEQWQRAEQSEARALEYKTEHAALLGTSQWQEVEIADLRDDVKRLMQTVSECEERALAAEKDKKQLLTRLVDALESAVDWAGYASEYFREKHQHQLDIDKLDAARDELAAIDAAIAGAKHD